MHCLRKNICQRAKSTFSVYNTAHKMLSTSNWSKSKNLTIDTERKYVKMKVFVDEKRKMTGPLVKNLFLGKLLPELMVYPEITTNEALHSLTSFLKPLEQFYEDKVQSQDIDTNQEIPQEVLTAFKDLGLFGYNIPEKYDGLEMPALEECRLSEVLGQDRSTFFLLSSHHHWVVQSLLVGGSEELRQRYLPRMSTGEISGAVCFAEHRGKSPTLSGDAEAEHLENNMYRLNGTKCWVTNADEAAFFIVFATVQRTMNTGAKQPVLEAFLVDKGAPGITVHERDVNVGIRGVKTFGVTFEDTVIPPDHKLPTPTEDIVLELNTCKPHCTAASLSAMLKRVLGETVKYVLEKKILSQKTVGINMMDYSVVQERLSDIAQDIYAIESVAYYTAGLYDQYTDIDGTVEACIVKIYSIEKAQRCLEMMMHILGSQAYRENHYINLLLRDIRVHHLFPVDNDMLRMYIAASCLQHYGKQFIELVKKRRDPLNNPGEVFKTIFNFSNKWDKPKMTIELYDHVHPNLSFDAEEIEIRIHRLSQIADDHCVLFGQDLIGEQMVMRHFAEIAIRLYVCLSCLSRATRAMAIGVKNHNVEIQLAHLNVLQTLNEVDAEMKHLQMLKHENGDENRRRITKSLLKEKGYSPVHPLTRNW